MLKTVLLTFILVFYIALTGCGTQGPLYIPEQRYPQKTQDKAPTTPETNADEKTTQQ